VFSPGLRHVGGRGVCRLTLPKRSKAAFLSTIRVTFGLNPNPGLLQNSRGRQLIFLKKFFSLGTFQVKPPKAPIFFLHVICVENIKNCRRSFLFWLNMAPLAQDGEHKWFSVKASEMFDLFSFYFLCFFFALSRKFCGRKVFGKSGCKKNIFFYYYFIISPMKIGTHFEFQTPFLIGQITSLL
jgi:hypothetical protein